ncbi:hypothetical protein ABBQ38_008723 [Trebouxia sp. C0009 RCD-2024]
MASIRHNNAVPVVQALVRSLPSSRMQLHAPSHVYKVPDEDIAQAAGQLSIPEIWEQKWFYGDFNRVLAVHDSHTSGNFADAFNASKQKEVARTCKHNLVLALQGSLGAQALLRLVEAIVGELDVLSGTLHGNKGHQATHLDAELRAHSALHRALEDLRQIMAEELASLKRAAAAAEARAAAEGDEKKSLASQLAGARKINAKVCKESSNRLKLLEEAQRDAAALRGRARTVNVWHSDHEEIVAQELALLRQATAAAEARAAAECAAKKGMSAQLAEAKKQNAMLERQLDVLETASQRNTMAIQALCIVVQQQAVQQIVGGQHLLRLQLELQEASRRASQQTALSEKGRQLSTTAAMPPLESTGPASQTVGEELCLLPQAAEASGSEVEAPALPKPALVNAEQEREEGCKLCDASCLGSMAPMVLQNAEASSSAVGAPALPKPAPGNGKQEREEDTITPSACLLDKLKQTAGAGHEEAEGPAAAELKSDTAGAFQPSSSSSEGRALKAPLTVLKPITIEKSGGSLELGSVTEAGEASVSTQGNTAGHIPAVHPTWTEPLSASLPNPASPSATVEEKTSAGETAMPTSQLCKDGASNGLSAQVPGGGLGRGMGQGGVSPAPGPLVDVRRNQHGLMAALPGFSDTHTGTTESDMSMTTGRGHVSGGLGAPGRGGRSGGDVVEGKWGKPALAPAPHAPGVGDRASVTPQHEQSGLKIGEAKAGQQRAIQALLNQLNRANFDTILAHIVVVGSETADRASVSGLANQVVDKALTEPTLCVVYAELCFQLDAALPNFEPPSQGAGRRPQPPSGLHCTSHTLLWMQLRNKCVEEFHKGMTGVAGLQALQKPEQVKAKEPCWAQATETFGSLRGRSLQEAQPAPCNDTQEREENRTNTPAKAPDGLDRFNQRMIAKKAGQQAQRRALANTHFMGHLYHKQLLSEKVMHSCINDLLTDIDTPEPANLECLIKLMSAVGRQLEANPLAKEYMRQYFQRIAILSSDMRLKNYMRLMLQASLQELIALRGNSWVAPGAAAGGPNMSANQGSGLRTGEAPPRHKDRAPAGPSNIQRNPEWGSEALPPGLSAGPSASGAVPSPEPSEMKPQRNPLTMERLEGRLKTTKLGYGRMHLPEEAEPGDQETAAIIRRVQEQQKKEEAVQQKEQKVLARFLKRDWGHSGFEALQCRRLSREQLQDKVWGALDAFAERRDSHELRHKVEALLPLTEPRQVFVEIPMVAIRKMRGVNCSLITEVLVQLCGGAQPTLPKTAVQSGTPSLLEAVMRHAPTVADWVGGVFGGLVSAGVLSLKEVANATLTAASRQNGEDRHLVDGGSAWKLMGAVLQAVAHNSGQSEMSKQWKHTGLQLDAFFPSDRPNSLATDRATLTDRSQTNYTDHRPHSPRAEAAEVEEISRLTAERLFLRAHNGMGCVWQSTHGHSQAEAAVHLSNGSTTVLHVQREFASQDQALMQSPSLLSSSLLAAERDLSVPVDEPPTAPEGGVPRHHARLAVDNAGVSEEDLLILEELLGKRELQVQLRAYGAKFELSCTSDDCCGDDSEMDASGGSGGSEASEGAVSDSCSEEQEDTMLPGRR